MEFLQSIDDSILKNTAGARDGCSECSGRSPTGKHLLGQPGRRQLSSVCFLLSATLLLICLTQSVSAQPGYRVGPLYWDKTGEVSVVVELPENSTGVVSEFELTEDGKPTAKAQGMEPFSKSKKWQLVLALCVDVSGTMVKPLKSAGKDPLTETKNALIRILPEGLLRSSDLVAVSSFASNIIHSRWFAPPGDGLKNAVEALSRNPEEQNTVLYDALYDALDHLKHIPQSKPVRRRVLVISDGHDEESKIKSINVVRDYATKLRIPIDVVARVRKDRASYVRKKGYTEDLRGLASETGGRFELAGPGQVHDALSEILTGVMNTPVLQFKRTIQTEGARTSRVGVNWQKSPLEVSIPAKMPKTQVVSEREEEPAGTKNKVTGDGQAGFGLRSLWAFVLTGLALALAFLAWFWIKKRDGTPPPDEPIHTPAPVGEPAPAPEPAPGRVTVVGNYFSPPGPGHPSAVLVGESGPVEGRQYPVDKDVYRIGEAPDNDLSIPGDDYVSAYHAALRLEQGSLFLFDEGSTNKTYLNGIEVGDSGAELGFGDRIQVGSSILAVTAPD